MCRTTGGTLLFDLDLYRKLTPASRRLFLKLKDRFWRSKQVFFNVDDLTVHGLGFSAERPLKKRKFDLANCLRELLEHGIIELGRGQTDVADLFLRRGKGVYVVRLFEGPYFRRPTTEHARTGARRVEEDALFEPLRNVGIDGPGIRRLLKEHSRKSIEQWLRIADAALHESPRGFPGFKSSPAAFLIDGVQNGRMPPDWFHAHDKERERQAWERTRMAEVADDTVQRREYERERTTAWETFLNSPEVTARFVGYRTAFEVFYRRVDPDRFLEAAQDAAHRKIEEEDFSFPEFGVWMLERRT